MTILSTIPASDTAATLLSAQLTALQTQATTLATNGNAVHARAASQLVIQKQRELAAYLLDSDHVNASSILSSASLSYGS